jgi:hypothetical protein
MNIKDIIEENVEYMKERCFYVETDSVNDIVTIGQESQFPEIEEDTEYFYLQDEEAADFINNCLKIEESLHGEIPLYDIQLSEACAYVDWI